MNTGDTCSGKFVAGACPGPSSVQVGAHFIILFFSMYVVLMR